VDPETKMEQALFEGDSLGEAASVEVVVKPHPKKPVHVSTTHAHTADGYRPVPWVSP